VQANAQVGMAKANFFPQLTLSGFGGRVSPKLSAFSHVWSLAAGLSGPIFQGGQILENYRANVAASEQAKLQYEQAVITAFQEVSSALTALEKLVQAEAEQARAGKPMRTQSGSSISAMWAGWRVITRCSKPSSCSFRLKTS
jgi:multidrug efflux system outer membrane protein